MGSANAKWHMLYMGFHEVSERLENKQNLLGPKSEPCGTSLIQTYQFTLKKQQLCLYSVICGLLPNPPLPTCLCIL